MILKFSGWQFVYAETAHALLGGIEWTTAHLTTSRGYDVPQPVNYVG